MNSAFLKLAEAIYIEFKGKILLHSQIIVLIVSNFTLHTLFILQKYDYDLEWNID